MVFYAEECTCLHEDEPNHGSSFAWMNSRSYTLFTSEAFAKQRPQTPRGFNLTTILAQSIPQSGNQKHMYGNITKKLEMYVGEDIKVLDIAQLNAETSAPNNQKAKLHSKH
jgi:hypothetical protein